jgi:hypothetical protein
MKYLSEVEGLNGISAKVVAASVSSVGKKLTTLELRYPRFIHSELMTHRLFSRNASSSRAIPVSKMIEQVKHNPATPIHWGLNQPGMQAQDEQVDTNWANNWWGMAAYTARTFAETANEMGLHKQITNRILEPWQFMTTLVSSTEWDNFFAQRISPAAQPEINELALCMKQAMEGATYTQTLCHLPYIRPTDEGLSLDDKMKVSVARCCRVSYNNLNADSHSFDDIERHDSLLESGHWSPFEHVAVAMNNPDIQSSNFRGWHQYRNILQKVKPMLPIEVDCLNHMEHIL